MKKKKLNAVHPVTGKKQVCIQINEKVLKFSDGQKVCKTAVKDLKILED